MGGVIKDGFYRVKNACIDRPYSNWNPRQTGGKKWNSPKLPKRQNQKQVSSARKHIKFPGWQWQGHQEREGQCRAGLLCWFYKVMKPGAQVTKTQPEVNVKAEIKPQDHRRLTWKVLLSFTLYKAKPYISVLGASEPRAWQHSRCVLAPEWQLRPS